MSTNMQLKFLIDRTEYEANLLTEAIGEKADHLDDIDDPFLLDSSEFILLEKRNEAVRIQKRIRRFTALLEERLLVWNEVTQSGSQEDLSSPPQLQAPAIPTLNDVDIKPFHGDSSQWQTFWSEFCIHVHNRTDISVIQKYTQLRKLIQGKAFEHISAFPYNVQSYDAAIQSLITAYSNDSANLVNLIREIISRRTDSPGQLAQIISTYLYIYQRFSYAILLDPQIDNPTTTMIILRALPQQLHRKIQYLSDNKIIPASLLLQRIQEWIHKEKIGFQINFGSSHSPTTLSSPSHFTSSSKNGSQSSPSHRSNRNSSDRSPTKSNLEKIQNKVIHKMSKVSLKGAMVCAICDKDHRSYLCDSFSSTHNKLAAARAKNLCLNCLRAGHPTRECPSTFSCKHCDKKHHTSLCLTPRLQDQTNQALEPIGASQDITMQVTSKTSGSNNTAMMCLEAMVCNPDAPSYARKALIFFDSGSSKSYISKELSNYLRLPIESKYDGIITTFGDQTLRLKSSIHNLQVIHANGNHSIIKAIQKETIASKMLYVSMASSLSQPPKLNSQHSSPDILIGADYFFQYMLIHDIQELGNGLFLSKTLLGPLISGTCPSTHGDFTMSAVETCVKISESSRSPPLENFTRFWELEQVGLHNQVQEDKLAVEFVKKTIKWDEKAQRYAVKWPWIDNIIPSSTGKNALPLNFGIAKYRLEAVVKKLGDLQAYDNIFKEQERSGIIEQVIKDPKNIFCHVIHYLPHHPVLKETPQGTKIRLVYDASAHCKGETSLNDHLLRGPVLLPDLCAVLLRFRSHKNVFLADIEKAFHQILLQEADRDVCRFLWLKDISKPVTMNNLKIYRFRVVPFGVKSSPFLLSMTILHHLERENSMVAQQAIQDLYVDNILYPFLSTEDGITNAESLRDSFSKINMNLRDFVSNDSHFNAKLSTITGSEVSALGLLWNFKKDIITFSLDFPNIPVKLTKRNLASITGKFFDPLGLLSPLFVPLKLLIQKAWQVKVDWDTPLPHEFSNELLVIHKNLHGAKILFPRRIESSFNPEVIHVCTDASANAYGACIYVQKGNQIDLIFSKSKVTPSGKALTIPQLELTAVEIGVKLLNYVLSNIHKTNPSIILWCDSKCVLSWITNKSERTTFVQNRVLKIRRAAHEFNIQFRYIPTQHNPADLLSRGTTVEDINSPHWRHNEYIANRLSSTHDIYPMYDSHPVHDCSSTSHDTTQFVNTSTPDHMQTWLLDETRLKQYDRLITTMTFIIFFLHARLKMFSYLASSPSLSPSSPIIREHAKLILLRLNQIYFPPTYKEKTDFRLFFDEKSRILRSKGRIENAAVSNDMINPIFLTTQSPLTRSLIYGIHRDLKHCPIPTLIRQVREQLWIPSIRKLCKSIKYNCDYCIKTYATPYQLPSFPQLPSSRTNPSPPFTHVGVDYLGPFPTQQKCWICLFTCLASRAIQCEVVYSLSGLEFLHILRRFIARRGAPSSLLSDNGLNFQFARRILTDSYIPQFLTYHSIEWKMITEFAPWQGGVYERMVGVFKKSLYAVISRQINDSLSLEEFVTFVYEAESIVNCRPLGYISSDLDSLPIRPCDLLIPGKPILNSPLLYSPSIDILRREDEMVIENYTRLEQISCYFWNVWRKDYLLALRERTINEHLKNNKTSRIIHPQINDTVIIEDPKLEKNLWRTGKIVSIPNKPNAKSATVLVENGRKLTRPLSSLFKLELTLCLILCVFHNSAASRCVTQHTNESVVFASQGMHVGISVIQYDKHFCYRPIDCKTQQIIRDSHSVSCGTFSDCEQWALQCSFSQPPIASEQAKKYSELLVKQNLSTCDNFDSVCEQNSITTSAFKIQTHDNQTFLLKSIDIVATDVFPQANFTCIGDPSVLVPAGSPGYCSSNICNSTTNTRFCYYPFNPYVSIKINDTHIPIRAWGMSKVHLPISHRSQSFCVDCEARCLPNAIAIHSGQSLASETTTKICFLMLNNEYRCDTTSNWIIEFPLAHALPLPISLSVYTNNTLFWDHSITCEIDICDHIPCWVCVDYIIFAFQCHWGYLAAIILPVIIALTCIMKTIRIVLYPLSLLLSKVWQLLIVVLCSYKTKNDTATTRKKFPMHRRLIVSLILLSHPIYGCDEVFSVSSQDLKRKESSNGTISIKEYNTVLHSIIPQRKNCLLFADNSALELLVKSPEMNCIKNHWYFTFYHKFLTPSVRKCYNKGSCTDQTCNSLTTQAQLPEFEYLGRTKSKTYCIETDGCWLNGCFSCKPSCLFYKILVSRLNDDLYEVFSCKAWEVTIPLEITYTHGTFREKRLFELTPGKVVSFHNKTFSLSSYSFPPLHVSESFLFNIHQKRIILSPHFSAPHFPIPGTPGQLQCTNHSLDSCTFADNTCTCKTMTYDSLKCSCPSTNLPSLFTDSSVTLPLVFGQYLLRHNNGSVHARLDSGASLSIHVRSSISSQTRVVSSSCVIATSSLVGCHSCFWGARFTAHCSTPYEDIHLTLVCPSRTYSLACSPKGLNNSLTYHTHHSIDKLACFVSCNDVTQLVVIPTNLSLPSYTQYSYFLPTLSNALMDNSPLLSSTLFNLDNLYSYLSLFSSLYICLYTLCGLVVIYVFLKFSIIGFLVRSISVSTRKPNRFVSRKLV